MKSYSVCLVLLLMMFGLAGCPDGGGSSAKIADGSPLIEDPTGDNPLPEDPITPVLTDEALESLSLSRAGETLEFTASTVSDSKCGGVYNITSASHLDGVVTLVTRIDSNSFVTPSTADCMIDVQMTLFAVRTTGNCQHTQMAAQIYSEFVTYTISRSGEGFSVSRALSSRVFERSCAYQLPDSAETDSVASEVYYE